MFPITNTYLEIYWRSRSQNSLLKNTNLVSEVSGQFSQRYNLHFGGYFYDGIYDRKGPLELPSAGGSFTMSQESLQKYHPARKASFLK